MTMKISFEIDTAEDFEKVRRYFLSGYFPVSEKEREEEGISPLSPPLPFPPTTPYPITPFNSPSFQEEERERDNKSRERVQKHRHGSFGNVLLTDAEFEKLHQKLKNADDKIEQFSKAKEARGYKYKSDYAAILKWRWDDELIPMKQESKSFGDMLKEIQSQPTWDIEI